MKKRKRACSLSLSFSLLLNHQSFATSYRADVAKIKKKNNNNNVADANGVKLNEQARESRAICIGRSIKVLSEHPMIGYRWNRVESREMSVILKNIILLYPY